MAGSSAATKSSWLYIYFAYLHPMTDKETNRISLLERWLEELQGRVERIEKELRLLATDTMFTEDVGPITVEGGFMDLIDVLDGLSLREGRAEEEVNVGALLDLLIRFLFRQEAQNTQIKLLILSQTHPISGELFDEIGLFLNDVEDERFTIQQLKFRWRQIEAMVRKEVKRLQKSGKSL